MSHISVILHTLFIEIKPILLFFLDIDLHMSLSNDPFSVNIFT